MGKFLDFVNSLIENDKNRDKEIKELKTRVGELNTDIARLEKTINALSYIVGSHNSVLSEMMKDTKQPHTSQSTKLPDIYPDKNKKPN